MTFVRVLGAYAVCASLGGGGFFFKNSEFSTCIPLNSPVVIHFSACFSVIASLSSLFNPVTNHPLGFVRLGSLILPGSRWKSILETLLSHQHPSGEPGLFLTSLPDALHLISMGRRYCLSTSGLTHHGCPAFFLHMSFQKPRLHCASFGHGFASGHVCGGHFPSPYAHFGGGGQYGLSGHLTCWFSGWNQCQQNLPVYFPKSRGRAVTQT
mmetsp:Transcript_95926/g.151008  ORF Transcript_95926/g.151008 Transcript_95926/m.151008 type:complete len:210 (-) Transcript_95926:893-1522(-)